MTDVRDEYAKLHREHLTPISARLHRHLVETLNGVERIDRVSVRVKNIDRFVAKASTKNGHSFKYNHPVQEIQDQIGARVVVFYKSDISEVVAAIRATFRAIESRTLQPEKPEEFSYFGYHQILLLPSEVRPSSSPANVTRFFELQIKTLFQHAWAEAEHDLVYKAFNGEVSLESRRLIHFAAAQAWGADEAFQSALSSINGSEEQSRDAVVEMPIRN